MIPSHARRLRALIAAASLAATVLPLGATPALAAGTAGLVAFGTAYTQDFDTLATTGTANTALPTGWDLAESGSSTRNNAAYAASTGSDTAGDVYSFGGPASSERAFGTLLSGSLTPTVGASLVNSTGGVITSLAIAYTGEQWRAGVASRNAADRLDFQYSLDATSLVSGTWTDIDPLDLNSPNTNAALGALDGNASGNRTAISGSITGLSIANGATVWIRWTDFNITSSDDGLAIDDISITPDGFTPVEDAAPAVTSTVPANGATGVPYDSNLSVTFSEPVNVGAGAFTLACSVSGAVTLAVSGGPATFTLDPAVGLNDGESCTLTVVAAEVSDQDTNDPPDTMALNFVVGFSPANVCQQAYTPAYAIQGSGSAAAIIGPVITQGVVVGDHEGPSPALRGFYLQDVNGDGDTATSDAIFVFNGNNNHVSLGDVVRVAGTAAEFQDQTQVSASGVTNCGTDSVDPTDVTFPIASAGFLERYEGMLVRLPQTMYVTEHFQLGRFGQVVMSAGSRLRQPTSVVEPGAPALAMQAANNLNRIIVDDSLQSQNPDPILFARGGLPLSASNTLRGGDTATNTIGVMTYTWAGNAASGNAFRVRPIGALGGYVSFQPANARPTTSPDVGGSIRVAGLNLLNYYNTFDGLPDTVDNCTAGVGGLVVDCRGADTLSEFGRQWPKTVAAILKLDAHVIGFNEIENDGYGPDSSISDLVARLNAATAPGTYAFIDADAGTGQVNALGLDAIRVGMIYRPSVVTPVGQTAVLNSVAFINGGDGVLRSRPSLAQAFEVNTTGARFIVDTNHLKSKGSACDAPDAGDGQGNCNAVRTNAANELVAWLATDPTGTGDPDILLIGDYNSYAMEDPIAAIEDGGYTNLVDDLLGDEAYSYVFDGQWAYLDYAFASQSLRSQVTGVGDYHINADEPSVLDYNTDFKTANLQAVLYAPDEFRVSDHDPVVVGLDLAASPKNDRPATGTGWILSPAGAVVGMPEATGKATFAFDVKYARNATVPQGSASFSFPAGGFSFVATSFDWLVTSAPVATMEGSGTVNGAGLYRFRITATDDAPDRIRFQVWSSSGDVVYDNGSAQAIGGGSIVIRPPK